MFTYRIAKYFCTEVVCAIMRMGYQNKEIIAIGITLAPAMYSALLSVVFDGTHVHVGCFKSCILTPSQTEIYFVAGNIGSLQIWRFVPEPPK